MKTISYKKRHKPYRCQIKDELGAQGEEGASVEKLRAHRRIRSATTFVKDMETVSGFTLVELSIVLIIIALLVAGVMAGRNLVTTAKLQTVTKEIREYDTAINQFKDKFKYYPGDLPNAATYWGTYDPGPPITGATNGDGNWDLGWSTEMTSAWRHLALSGFISGTYTGVDNGTPDLAFNINIPASKWHNTGYLLRWIGYYSTRAGNAIEIGQCTTFCNVPAFSTPEAYFIDTKIDDGKASSGRFLSISATTALCVDQVWTNAAGANYVLTNNVVDCATSYFLDKEF